MPNLCMICNKRDNNLCLQCDACKNYLHVNCVQMDAEDAKRITRQRTKGVKFFCDSCNKSTDQFNEIKSLLENIDTRLSKLERDPCQLSPKIFESVVREAKERMQRENNIIAYDLPESEGVTDIDAANEIVGIVLSPNASSSIVSVARLSSKIDNKPRPLRVVFNNPFVVKSVLKVKAKLKNVDAYKKVFLKNDETSYQRSLFSKCKESLNARLAAGEADLKIKYVDGIPTVVPKSDNQKN